MNLILKELELTNYRNIAHANYVFSGDSKIVGENRIGKTNTLEAIVWLLTDKLLNGETDIASIKPNHDTRLEVRVAAKFDVCRDDGTIKELSIAKEYGEEWVKTRGSDELIFKGHYLNYWYNDTKQNTKTDFYTLLCDDFNIDNNKYRGIELLRLLVDPLYVGEIGDSADWKYLREFIINMVGNVSDEDVFAANPATKIIEKDLETRNGRIDEVKKYYNNISKTIKEEIIGLDSNIKMLESTERPSEDELNVAKAAIEQSKDQIASLQKDMTGDALIISIDKEINNANSRMNEITKDNLSNRTSPSDDLRKEVDDLNRQYSNLLSDKAQQIQAQTNLENNLEKLKLELENKTTLRQGYISTLKDLDEKIASCDGFTSVCPTCHRPLEGEELEKAKADYLASLKAERESTLEKGKANKAAMTTLNDAIENTKAAIENKQKEIDDLKEKGLALVKEIESKGNELKSVKDEPIKLPEEYYQLESKVKDLKEQKAKAIADNNALNSTIKERIQEQQSKIDTYQKVVDDYNYACRQLEKLEEVRLTKQDKGRELASIEQRKTMVELFTKTKLQMLDERVASVFGNIKFQLIKENINGGYDPICKPYIYDVVKGESTKTTWRSGSKSEKVTTGVAIAEKIKAKLHLPNLPFLFDEGGEISSDTFKTRFDTSSQLICVKVQDNIERPLVMDL